MEGRRAPPFPGTGRRACPPGGEFARRLPRLHGLPRQKRAGFCGRQGGHQSGPRLPFAGTASGTGRRANSPPGGHARLPVPLAVPAHASSVRICFIVPVLPPAGERPGRPARGRCNPTCRQLHGSHLLSVASAYARRVSHLYEICIQNVSVQNFLPRRCHAGRCGAQKCGMPRFRGMPQNFSISGGQRQRVPYSAFCISMWGWPQSRNTSPTGENPRAA